MADPCHGANKNRTRCCPIANVGNSLEDREHNGSCGKRIRTRSLRDLPSLWRDTTNNCVTHVQYIGTGTATHADTQSSDMTLNHQSEGVSR